MTHTPQPAKPTLGFALVTHRDAEQILFLCQRLTAMFDSPPIAIHHDFSQTPLDQSRFPANVRFVKAWVKTGWGNIGVVEALLSAMRLLYRNDDPGFGDPDWVTSLSSADYPIQTAESILRELRSTPFEGFLDTRVIHDPGGRFINEPLGEHPFKQPRFHQFAFNRYVATMLMSSKWAKRLRTPVERWVLRWPWLTARLTPFHDGVQCYAGDAWMTVNRRVAGVLLEETPFRQTLLRHYGSRPVPEESFYQTLLGNTPGLHLSDDNRRYTDWKGCYAHPRTLGRDDFPRLLAATDHFARKFPLDPALLRDLDLAVAEKAAATPRS